MSSEERLRVLLADLGKATLRGVKKCPKCGTYNGSRGLCCKNKFCDAVFKEPGEKRKLSTEASKLITGSSVQIYSVRTRDKGPDTRGFVQLSQFINSAGSSNNLASTGPQNTTLCFVDGCETNFDTSVLKCHEEETSENVPKCQHIQAALKCYSEAQPLTLKNSILSSLIVNNELKQQIWTLATETPGPLVQRVSKTIMVVKCKPTPKHPLGYLHFLFYTMQSKHKTEQRFFCSCTAFKTSSAQTKRCVHFYACICAFASDEKLSEEFQYYIKLSEKDAISERQRTCATFSNNDNDKLVAIDLETLTQDDTHLLIFRDDALMVQNFSANRMDIEGINLEPAILQDPTENLLEDASTIISQVNNLEVLEKGVVFNDVSDQMFEDQCLLVGDIKNLENGTVKILETNMVFDAETMKLLDSSGLIETPEPIIENYPLTEKPFEPVSQPSNPTSQPPVNTAKRKRDQKNSLVNLNNLNSIEPKKGKTKTNVVKRYQQPSNCSESVDEAGSNLSFIRWLASITERINQTMHFQFDGKPDTLVFHAPQIFFECLRERISCGAKKKRLPNSTMAFVRKDGVPLGTFIKYTWRITNILHVVSIFETPFMPLEITRSFVQNADGTYDLYKRKETDIDKYKKTGNNALIKPLELKTYLKVGHTSPNQTEPTPFLIEWIPDILPISKIGELRIRFEFGHVKNDSPQRCQKIELSKN